VGKETKIKNNGANQLSSPSASNEYTVKLLIEPHGALLEGVNDCSFKNRV